MGDNTLKKIDRFSFSLKDVIGIGSFGKVFKGKDEQDGDTVAVKMMDKRKIQNDEYLMAGLFSEIQVMKKLKSQYVVQLLEVLETSNNYYIIQEFCDGGDFRHIIKKRKYLPEEEAKEVLINLLSGFTELLKHGIIHRDLKPENILASKGMYKLADFGFAKTVDNFKKQMLESLVGTPLYMSPQILKHETYTTKSDIWSLALIYYEMLFGKTPWQARSQYELVQKIEKEPVVFPDTIPVSKQSKDFIMQCLQKEEGARISWDDIFKHDLFDGFFNSYIEKRGELENKAIFIINNLRQKIYSERLDLEILFQKYGLSQKSKMDIKAFSNMMLEIDKSLTKQQIEYLFNKFDSNGDLSIDFQEFTDWLQEHNVRMSMRDSSNKSSSHPKRANTSHVSAKVEQKAIEAIKLLCDTIRNMNINLQLLFGKYNKTQTQMLDLSEFGQMMRSMNQNSDDEVIEAAFSKFDINQDGFISFQEFCEAVQNYSGNSILYSATNYSTNETKNQQQGAQQINQMYPNSNMMNNFPNMYQQQQPPMYNQNNMNPYFMQQQANFQQPMYQNQQQQQQFNSNPQFNANFRNNQQGNVNPYYQSNPNYNQQQQLYNFQQQQQNINQFNNSQK